MWKSGKNLWGYDYCSWGYTFLSRNKCRGSRRRPIQDGGRADTLAPIGSVSLWGVYVYYIYGDNHKHNIRRRLIDWCSDCVLACYEASTYTMSMGTTAKQGPCQFLTIHSSFQCCLQIARAVTNLNSRQSTVPHTDKNPTFHAVLVIAEF